MHLTDSYSKHNCIKLAQNLGQNSLRVDAPYWQLQQKRMSTPITAKADVYTNKDLQYLSLCVMRSGGTEHLSTLRKESLMDSCI